jgi:DNA-directed RNA polymerase specialized sigma24 family protein
VQWLRSLPWRVRQAVILVHGQHLTACDAAARLGISERTIFHDLSAADARFQESRAEGQKLLLC